MTEAEPAVEAIKATLNKLRDVQNPEQLDNKLGYCLGSSKFLSGKLIGLFKPDSTLRDFHNSAWAGSHGGAGRSKTAWGKLGGEKDFNARILPAAMANSSAAVRNVDSQWQDVEFHHFYGHAQWADALLLGRVPLVVGVNYHGGTGADHYMTVLRSNDFKVWAVDSWAPYEGLSVVQLPDDFSFANPNPNRYKTNVSFHTIGTLIPSAPSYFGHYRNKVTRAAIGITRVV